MDRIFERVRLAERKPLGGHARYFRSVVPLGRMCGYIVLRGVPVQKLPSVQTDKLVRSIRTGNRMRRSVCSGERNPSRS